MCGVEALAVPQVIAGCTQVYTGGAGWRALQCIAL
jgi:hypothetical protein